jgi:hypothetical protein
MVLKSGPTVPFWGGHDQGAAVVLPRFAFRVVRGDRALFLKDNLHSFESAFLMMCH